MSFRPTDTGYVSNGKVLDVDGFLTLTEETKRKLVSLGDTLTGILEAVEGIIEQDAVFKGQTGDAIRGYFQDVHQYVLLSLLGFLADYATILENTNNSLKSFESSDNGYINESFLEGNVEIALNRVQDVTGTIIDDANAAMEQVSDIISLTKIDSSEIDSEIDKARNFTIETVENLHAFDYETAKQLEPLKNTIDTLLSFVQILSIKTNNGNLTSTNYSPEQLNDLPYYRRLLGEMVEKSDLKEIFSFDYPAYGEYETIKYIIYEDGTYLMVYTLKDEDRTYYELVDRLPEITDKDEEEVNPILGFISAGLDWVPLIGNIKAGIEAGTGKNYITGEEVSDVDRKINTAAILFGGLGKFGGRTAKNFIAKGENGPTKKVDAPAPPKVNSVEKGKNPVLGDEASEKAIETYKGKVEGFKDKVSEATENSKWKSSDLLDELSNIGVKYNADEVMAITKTPDGKLVWLETGNPKAGFEHVMRHADDFAAKGIKSSEIPDLLMEALSNGKIVGYQGRGKGRPIYEVVFNGQSYRVAITVGNNGFIVGANPTSLP